MQIESETIILMPTGEVEDLTFQDSVQLHAALRRAGFVVVAPPVSNEKSGASQSAVEMAINYGTGGIFLGIGGATVTALGKVLRDWIKFRGDRKVTIVVKKSGKLSREIQIDATNLSDSAIARLFEDIKP